MATVYEQQDSREFEVSSDAESETKRYYVSDAPGEDDAYQAVRAESPKQLGAMFRHSIKGTPLAVNLWRVDVQYATIDRTKALDNGDPAAALAPGANDNLDSSFSIDTTGGTTHITQALNTRFKVTPAGPQAGPDPQNAIGVTDDGVEGCDIYSPAFQFSRTVQRANVSMAYINAALYGLVGRINALPFYNFAGGEVLYLGCSGSFNVRDRWSLTHKFACSPNEAGVVIGNGITLPFKAGWEYVWVGYDKKVIGNRMMHVPAVAYVQDVYKVGDFSLLEIGV